ncbi:unnamed protein product [Nippostrongylus brasiliensis]|uniref:Transcription termination factor 2 (inferred by orthology to a human protein) n=1 Tax=Nippostrongylus brasiliensis TaxID=27835 RepID=A0A0N4XXY8_NIPBR|nr:unnamed protein product [Nippostrongylus brasiliensis]
MGDISAVSPAESDVAMTSYLANQVPRTPMVKSNIEASLSKLPLTSTPKPERTGTAPSLSDSFASLSVCDDRPLELASPRASHLTNDQGKLRDYIFRKGLSKQKSSAPRNSGSSLTTSLRNEGIGRFDANSPFASSRSSKETNRGYAPETTNKSGACSAVANSIPSSSRGGTADTAVVHVHSDLRQKEFKPFKPSASAAIADNDSVIGSGFSSTKKLSHEPHRTAASPIENYNSEENHNRSAIADDLDDINLSLKEFSIDDSYDAPPNLGDGDIVEESISIRDLSPRKQTDRASPGSGGDVEQEDVAYDVIILSENEISPKESPEVVTISPTPVEERPIKPRKGLEARDRRPERPESAASDEVQVIKTVVRKYAKETTANLQSMLNNVQRLIRGAFNLPDGGAKLVAQRDEIMAELRMREEMNVHATVIERVEPEEPPNLVERQPFPGHHDRRNLNINDVLRDPQPIVHRAIQEKALIELHKSLTSQPDAKQLTETPAGLNCTLKEHQQAGLTWMKWRESLEPKGGILADEMGLGKTLSIIALIVDSKTQRKKRRQEGTNEVDKERKKLIREKGLVPSHGTLVIAPAALIYHWETEIKTRCDDHVLKVLVYHSNRKRFNADMLARSDVVITTYTLVANDVEKGGGAHENPLGNIHWERIVLDEAHNVKNRKTKASKGVCRLNADARWCVTGTPLHNNLWDLYSLMKFLKVEYFSEEMFWKNYVASATKKSVERLNLLMKNFVLRREKNTISPLTEKPLIELPEKHVHDHKLEFTEGERKAYDLMFEASRAKVKELLTEEEVEQRFGGRSKKSTAPLVAKNVFLGTAGAGSVPDSNFRRMGCMLVILLRLRQACIHFSLTRNAVDLEAFQSIDSENPLTAEEQENLANMTIDSFLSPQKVDDVTFIFKRKFVSAKIQLTLELLESILEDGEKCVIVSQWTSFLKILEKHIKKRFPSLAQCSSITGEVSPSERQERVTSFNEDESGINIMLISITAGGVGLNLTGGNHLILMDLHWNPALELQARDRVHRMGQTREVHLHKIVMKGSIEERVLDLQMKKMELAKNVLQGAVSKKNMNLTMADLKFLFDLDPRV